MKSMPFNPDIRFVIILNKIPEIMFNLINSSEKKKCIKTHTNCSIHILTPEVFSLLAQVTEIKGSF